MLQLILVCVKTCYFKCLHSCISCYSGECLGEESYSDSDIVDCLLKLREKTFSSMEMNLHNEQKKQTASCARMYNPDVLPVGNKVVVEITAPNAT